MIGPDITTYVNLVDSAAGTPETGLTITNIDATYTRNRSAAVKNDLTALAAVDTAHTDNKGIEVDATNAPGIYRIDWPDAAFATGVDKVILTVTCSGCAPASVVVELVGYDPSDAVRLGLTALPNAAADGAGGLPISDAGGLDLDAKIGALTYGTANRVNVQVYGMEANTVTATAVADGAIDAGAIASDALTAAKFAADCITAAKIAADAITEIQSGLSTLDAAGVRTAVGLASANLDTQLAALAAYIDTEIASILAAVDTEVAAIKAKTDSLTFTVAGQVDANIKSVAGTTVTGAGTTADPWGP